MAAVHADDAAIEDEEEGLERGNDMAGMKLKDILRDMRGRKRKGIPMPSTVQRKEENRKRRKEEREKSAAANMSGANPASITPQSEAANAGQNVGASATGTAQAGADKDAGAGGESLQGERTGTAGSTAQGEDGDDDAVAAPVVVAPKVTIDADGNIVIDKESLVVSAGVVSTTDTDKADIVTIDNGTMSRHVTSSSFTKRDSASKWSPEDNNKFFEALSRFGTDFALIEHAFPARSRRQIKLKFKREERLNPAKVNQFLNSRARLNIKDTRKEFGLKGDPPPEPVVPLLGNVLSSVDNRQAVLAGSDPQQPQEPFVVHAVHDSTKPTTAGSANVEGNESSDSSSDSDDGDAGDPSSLLKSIQTPGPIASEARGQIDTCDEEGEEDMGHVY